MTTPLEMSNETRTTTIARRRRREILNIRRVSSAGMTSSASIERAVASAMKRLKDDNFKNATEKDSSLPSKIRKVCIGESEVVVKTELLVDPATLLDEVTSTELIQKNKVQSTTTTTKSTYSSSRRTTTTTTETTSSKQYVKNTTTNKHVSKEEASALRREARRVRNRESAAASRAKIRNRIEELEKEVNMWKSEARDWKEKYDNDASEKANEEVEMWKSEAQKWKGKYDELNDAREE